MFHYSKRNFIKCASYTQLYFDCTKEQLKKDFFFIKIIGYLKDGTSCTYYDPAFIRLRASMAFLRIYIKV